jgi:phenylacetate-CoA ligase
MSWNEEVAGRDYMPIEERRALQLKRLQATVQRVYERVPFYRKALNERGIEPSAIRSMDDISRLPFTTRHDLLDHYPLGLLAVPREQVIRIHASSGTKGKPKIVAYTRNDIDSWGEVAARALICAGVRPGEVVHNAYGYGLFTGGLGVHGGAEYLGTTVVPISSGNTQRQIMLLHDLQATTLTCTPSYALTIAETLAQMGLGPDYLYLKRGIFGAEPWTEGLRNAVEKGLGIQALDIYGLSEVMGPGVAMECAEEERSSAGGTRTLHIFEDHFFPEIVDPDTGEPLPYGQEGELVFTTITKEALPLLRYRTGDLCTLIPDRCVCGRTLVRMSQIKARVDDMLIIRGVNVFPSEIERVLLNVNELAPYYQVMLDVKQTLDEVTVETEVTREFQELLGDAVLSSDADGWAAHEQVVGLQHKIGSALHDALGLRLNVRVFSPGTLPRSEGKAGRVVDRRRAVKVGA